MIKAKVVSIDDNLNAGKPGDELAYWDRVDYPRLTSEVTREGERIVLDGRCALKVLARMDLQFDYHIFTKLIKDDNTHNQWEPEEYLNERMRLPKSRDLRDTVVYYREYKPFERCDLIIERHIRWLAESDARSDFRADF
jgi:hypothetical protein